MKIVLASGNKGKIKEFEKLMPNDEVIAFKEILGNIEIIEDQNSFKGNAIKKAQTIYDKLIEKDAFIDQLKKKLSNGNGEINRNEAKQILTQVAISKNPILILEGNNDSLWQIVGMTFFVQAFYFE